MIVTSKQGEYLSNGCKEKQRLEFIHQSPMLWKGAIPETNSQGDWHWKYRYHIGIHFFTSSAFAGTPGSIPPDSTLQPTAPCNCGILDPWNSWNTWNAPRNPGPVKLLRSGNPFSSPGTPLAEIAKLLMLLGNNNLRSGVLVCFRTHKRVQQVLVQ